MNTDFFPKLKEEVSNLQIALGKAGRGLPKYLLEICRNKISDLRETVSETQERVAPKKKFQFEKRKRKERKNHK
eukprot:UN26583